MRKSGCADCCTAEARKAPQNAPECFQRGIRLDPNHPALQRMLGVMYHHGHGVPRDHVQAAVWYSQGSRAGKLQRAKQPRCTLSPRGQGVLDWQGAAIQPRFAEAAVWYRKAAEQGLAEAQYELGTMYREGQGVPQDYVEAARWYRKAGDLSCSRALQSILLVENEQPVRDIAVAILVAGGFYCREAATGHTETFWIGGHLLIAHYRFRPVETFRSYLRGLTPRPTPPYPPFVSCKNRRNQLCHVCKRNVVAQHSSGRLFAFNCGESQHSDKSTQWAVLIRWERTSLRLNAARCDIRLS